MLSLSCPHPPRPAPGPSPAMTLSPHRVAPGWHPPAPPTWPQPAQTPALTAAGGCHHCPLTPGSPVSHISPLLTLTSYRASCSSPRTCSTSHEPTCLVGTRQPPPVASPSPSHSIVLLWLAKRPTAGPTDSPSSAGIKAGAQLSPVCCGVSRGAAPARQGPIPESMIGHRCVLSCQGLRLCRGGVRPQWEAPGGCGRG